MGMDKMAIARRKCARGAVLTLLFGNPRAAVMQRTLEYALMQDDPQTANEIGSHIYYLADKGYVKVYLGDEVLSLVQDPPREALVRLTAKGIDLMEGTLEEMGRKRERTRIVSRMDELPDDIRVQIESMLLDKTISYKEIADWATDSGYPISKSAIGRYAQRTGRAAMRLQYARENANAIITAMQEHRGLELSDAANALVMDNLIQVLSDASAEDYGEIPLPKLIELVLKNQRNAVYKERMVRAYAKDVETVRRALMAELTEQVRHNPELLKQLEEASLTAAEKVVEASET